MREALHDLSQPLTALECGLFLGTMSPDGVRAPTAEELMATVLEAQHQCGRLTQQVRALHGRLNGNDGISVTGADAERKLNQNDGRVRRY